VPQVAFLAGLELDSVASFRTTAVSCVCQALATLVYSQSLALV